MRIVPSENPLHAIDEVLFFAKTMRLSRINREFAESKPASIITWQKTIRKIPDNIIKIVWQASDPAVDGLCNRRVFASDVHRGYQFHVGIGVDDIEDERQIAYFISGRKYPLSWVRTLWNMNNPLVMWLTKVKKDSEDGKHSLADRYPRSSLSLTVTVPVMAGE